MATPGYTPQTQQPPTVAGSKTPATTGTVQSGAGSSSSGGTNVEKIGLNALSQNIGNAVKTGNAELVGEIRLLVGLLAQRERREQSTGPSPPGHAGSVASATPPVPATPGGQMIGIGPPLYPVTPSPSGPFAGAMVPTIPGYGAVHTPPGGQMVAVEQQLQQPIPINPLPAIPVVPTFTGELVGRQPFQIPNDQAPGSFVPPQGQPNQLVPYQGLTPAGNQPLQLPIPPAIQNILNRLRPNDQGDYELFPDVTADLIEQASLVIRTDPTFNMTQVAHSIQDAFESQSQELATHLIGQQWFQTFMRAFFITCHSAAQQRDVAPIVDAINLMTEQLVAGQRTNRELQLQIVQGQAPPQIQIDFNAVNDRLDQLALILAQRNGLPVDIVSRSLPIVNPIDPATGALRTLQVDTGFSFYQVPGSNERLLAVYNDPSMPVGITNFVDPATGQIVPLRARVGQYNERGFLGVAFDPQQRIQSEISQAPGAPPISVAVAGGINLQAGNIQVLPEEVQNAIVNSAAYLNPYARLSDDQLRDKFKEMGFAHYQYLVQQDKGNALRKLNIITEMQPYAQNILEYNQGKQMYADDGFQREAFDIFVKTNKRTPKGVPLDQTYRYLPKSIPEAHVKFDGKHYTLTQGDKKITVKNYRDIQRIALQGGEYAQELNTFREIRKGINTKEAPLNIMFKGRKW